MSLFGKNKRSLFLIIEYLNHAVKCTFCLYNPIDQAINIKNIKVFDPKDSESLRRYIKRYDFFDNLKVILGIDSSWATTIQSSITLVRDQPQEVIDEIELDNLISQFIWKMFDRERRRISKNLGVNEIDVILGDAKVIASKLDGHRVISPIGFKSTSLEIILRQTYLIREIYERLKSVLPFAKVVSVIETRAGMVFPLASLVNKGYKQANLIVNVTKDQGFIFGVDKFYIKPLAKLNFGLDNLIAKLAGDFYLDKHVCADLFNYCFLSQQETKFKRVVHRYIGEWILTLFSSLEKLKMDIPKKQWTIFSTADFGKNFFNEISQKYDINFLRIDEDFLLNRFNFKVACAHGKDLSDAIEPIMLFLDWHILPKVQPANKMANKKVRWLLPLNLG